MASASHLEHELDGGEPRGRGSFVRVNSFDDAELLHEGGGSHGRARSGSDSKPCALHVDVEVDTPAELVAFDASFWARYALTVLWGQARVVWPIALYMMLFKSAVLQLPAPRDLSHVVWAVNAVVVGLGLFLEGLKFGLMPLSEAVGKTLPVKVPLPTTLAVALVLGVGVTFAEPAIGALQTVGGAVDVHKAPYLYHLLNAWSFWLVCAVGLGVGAASVVGVLRFVKGWSIKPLIYWSLAATLGMTASVQLLAPRSFRGVLGLAWDCGAVTTGPVTVPCVIALGVGVTAAANASPNPLSCFGLVTMASLLPVVTVLVLGLTLLHTKTPAEIIAAAVREQRAVANALVSDGGGGGGGGASGSLLDETPWREIGLSTRALLPLLLFLRFVLVTFLRERLPRVVIRSKQSERPRMVTGVAPGLAASYAGLCCFNIGLTHGLARLGQEGGEALPAAWMHVTSSPRSPLFAPREGVAVALAFAFLLGVGATLAEPALAALGHTVHRLSKGRFPRRVISGAVPLGVALGLVLGVVKIMYSLQIADFVMLLYPIAAVVTSLSTEEFTNIGWDSAGVTTGPVTVPLVLSLGSGVAEASHSQDGFGMLTLSSICPILAVLLYGQWQQYRHGRPSQRELAAQKRLLDDDDVPSGEQDGIEVELVPSVLSAGHAGGPPV